MGRMLPIHWCEWREQRNQKKSEKLSMYDVLLSWFNVQCIIVYNANAQAQAYT